MAYYIIDTQYDMKVLAYLYGHQGTWVGLWERHFEDRIEYKDHPDVSFCFPKQYPRILQLTTMRRLYRKGLIGGCDCGCRGDFEITDKGLEVLGLPRLTEYTGY